LEKIKCLNCGNENSKNSVYCESCGASLFELNLENEIKKEEKPKSFNKKLLIIPIAILGIIISYYAFFSGYQIEDANELLYMSDQEIGLADAKIDEYNQHVDNVKSKYPYLFEDEQDYNISSSDRLKGLEEYYSHSEEGDLIFEEIFVHYEKAKEYSQKVKKLRLPDWYYECSDYQTSAIDSWIKACETHKEGENNAGKILNSKVNMQAAEYDYTMALFYGYYTIEDIDGYSLSKIQEEFEIVVSLLDSSLEYLDVANGEINTTNLSKIKNEILCQKEFWDYGLSGIKAEIQGNEALSSSYYQKASSSLEKCGIANFEPYYNELKNWEKSNVDLKYESENLLFQEGHNYYEKAYQIWNENYEE